MLDGRGMKLEALLHANLHLVQGLASKARDLTQLHQRFILLPWYLVEGVPAEQPDEHQEDFPLGEVLTEADAAPAAEGEQALRKIGVD